MNKPNTQTLKPELLVNKSIVYSPTVTLASAVLIDAVEESNEIPSLTKTALRQIIVGIALDNSIKVIDFLLKAKELLIDSPNIYDIVENIIKSLLNQ